MQERNSIKSIIYNRLSRLFKRVVLVFLLSLIVGSTIYVSAAFVSPRVGPASSTQDFAENILGANNADNEFDSGLVASSSDGSIVERIEYVKAAYLTSLSCVSGSTIDYSLQKNIIYEDTVGLASSTDNLLYAYNNDVDQNKEEGEWASTTDTDINGATVASGVVKRDMRSGLYWTDCYALTPGGGSCSYASAVADADDGLDAEGGQAIDWCEALSLDADGDAVDETDWYLPSLKEVMSAVINGAGNNISHAGEDKIVTSTHDSDDDSSVWHMDLGTGDSQPMSYSSTGNAFCVRRNDD